MTGHQRRVWERWSTFWVGPNRWARENPWQWAVVAGVVAFLAVWLTFGSVLAGAVVGIVCVPLSGWSVSRGPGRKFLDWRLRGRD
jgi:hypothetical protein